MLMFVHVFMCMYVCIVCMCVHVWVFVCVGGVCMHVTCMHFIPSKYMCITLTHFTILTYVCTISEATRNLSTNAIRFHTILSAAQTTGEDEKATQGDQYTMNVDKLLTCFVMYRTL